MADARKHTHRAEALPGGPEDAPCFLGLCGQEGTVLRTVRRSGMVLVMLDSGTDYYAWPWNLKLL